MDKNILPVFLREISPSIIDKLLAVTKQHSVRDFNIVNTFWKMSRSQLNTNNIEYYLDFKRTMNENLNILSKWDAKDLFLLMGNSLNNFDPSNINVEKELFEISDIMLKNNIIFNRDGSLTASDYLLYIWRAFNANEFEALEKFSLKYISKLPEDNIEYAGNYSKAFILFGKEKYDEALGLITSMNHPGFIIKVRMKLLKAKCLYELNDYITFESEYKSTYHFLKNNRSLSDKVKNDTKYLFENIKLMFRLKEKFSTYEFNRLKKEISEATLNKRSWLRLKLNEFH